MKWQGFEYFPEKNVEKPDSMLHSSSKLYIYLPVVIEYSVGKWMHFDRWALANSLNSLVSMIMKLKPILSNSFAETLSRAEDSIEATKDFLGLELKRKSSMLDLKLAGVLA